jgi:hypothetical protein
MKQGRFSEEQIVAILKEAEAGARPAELCRQNGISDAEFIEPGKPIQNAFIESFKLLARRVPKRACIRVA